MNSRNSRPSSQRSGRGSRRSHTRPRNSSTPTPAAPKLSFWQKLKSFFTGQKTSSGAPVRHAREKAPRSANTDSSPSRPARIAEPIEVTTPKLYIGNLSFDAVESDLMELFKGVGAVRQVEVVTNKYNDKSKGFGFVTMSTVAEAKRAVAELHDKEFFGRRLIVNGAKSGERQNDYHN